MCVGSSFLAVACSRATLKEWVMRWVLTFAMCLFSAVALAQQPTAELVDAPQPTASVRDVRWDKVEDLLPGETVEVRERADGVRTECALDSVDDAVLVCEVENRYHPLRRLVYPHEAIDRVWVTRASYAPSGRAVLIGAGVGGLLGRVAGSGSSAGQTCLSVLLGGLLGYGLVELFDSHTFRPWTQRLLIYAAAKT